jgi:hypothetical protein
MTTLSTRTAKTPLPVGEFLFSRVYDVSIIKESAMFVYALLLIVLLPIAFLSSSLEDLFSSEELTEMGIHLENAEA